MNRLRELRKEKEIHFTGYEHQILSWNDLNTGECFTLLILQQLSKVSKDPRGTYITNERLSKILHCNPSTASGYISKLKQKGYIVKITRVGATGRYIKTRDYNHSTYTQENERVVLGTRKLCNSVCIENSQSRNRLKELRKKKKLTQKELAEKFNMPETTLWSYETGQRNPKRKTWQQMADFFDVSIPYLQGKILFVDLSEDEQRIFTDVLDVLITTTDNKAIHVLEALLNSFKECYFEENTRIAPEKNRKGNN